MNSSYTNFSAYFMKAKPGNLNIQITKVDWDHRPEPHCQLKIREGVGNEVILHLSGEQTAQLLEKLQEFQRGIVEEFEDLKNKVKMLEDEVFELEEKNKTQARTIETLSNEVHSPDPEPWTQGKPANCWENCPNCDWYVDLEVEMKRQPCPECGAIILPCDICPRNISDEPNGIWECEKCPLHLRINGGGDQ